MARTRFGSHIEWNDECTDDFSGVLTRRQCATCGRCSCADYLRSHVFERSGRRPHECAHCGAAFGREFDLSFVHEYRHMNRLPWKLGRAERYAALRRRCARCQYKCDTLEEMGEHGRTAHAGEPLFYCGRCGGGGWPADENEPAHADAGAPAEYECKLCGKRFATADDRRRHTFPKHLTMYNLPDLDYVCDVCDMQFFSQHALSNHERVHTGERPYKCGPCGTAYKTAATLRRHETTMKHVDRLSDAGE